MNLLKKLHFYKRALQIMIALNVLVVTAGVIATVSYFSSIQFFKVLAHQNTERLVLLSSMQTDLVALASREPGKKVPYSYIRHLESLRNKLEQWPDSGLAQIALPESVEEATIAPSMVASIQERIMKEQATLREQIVQGSKNLTSLTMQLAWLGFFTFIFGILLPILAFKRLNFEVVNTRHKIEERASHWIAQWFETHAKYGDKPMQDPTFWAKIILLSIETFAPHSRHPFMHFLGEFAPTLRREIETERELAFARANGDVSSLDHTKTGKKSV